MNIIALDSARMRLRGTTAAAAVETRDQIVKRCVVEECLAEGVPSDLAHYCANQAAQIVRNAQAKGITREAGAIVANAVKQARQAYADRLNPTPPRPTAA